jgi:hypothetical protein
MSDCIIILATGVEWLYIIKCNMHVQYTYIARDLQKCNQQDFVFLNMQLWLYHKYHKLDLWVVDHASNWRDAQSTNHFRLWFNCSLQTLLYFRTSISEPSSEIRKTSFILIWHCNRPTKNSLARAGFELASSGRKLDEFFVGRLQYQINMKLELPVCSLLIRRNYSVV